MGIALQEVVFEGKAPRLEELSEKISDCLGLALIATELDDQIKGDLYDVRGKIRLADFPKEAITVYAYRAGGVHRHMERAGMAEMPMAGVVQGANEKPGTQTVYVETCSGMEPTLALAAVAALQALGGRIAGEERDPASYERWVTRTSVAELRRRLRRNRNRTIIALAGAILLSPILIPIWALWLVWTLLALPWRIFRAWRILRRTSSGHSAM